MSGLSDGAVSHADDASSEHGKDLPVLAAEIVRLSASKQPRHLARLEHRSAGALAAANSAGQELVELLAEL